MPLILTNSLNPEKPLPSNLFVLVFWLAWVQEARTVRLEQLNASLSAEIDRLYAEGRHAA
jgi:hypothetical protein